MYYAFHIDQWRKNIDFVLIERLVPHSSKLLESFFLTMHPDTSLSPAQSEQRSVGRLIMLEKHDVFVVGSITAYQEVLLYTCRKQPL